MGQKTIDKAPATKLLYNEASSILGYDLLKLCLNGPKDLLDRTEHCQIAIVIASLGIIWRGVAVIKRRPPTLRPFGI